MNLWEKTQYLQQKLKEGFDHDELPQVYHDLVDIIIEHNKRYYQENSPIISDEEYDFLFAELKRIEQENPFIIAFESPTQRLLGQIDENSTFEKVQHRKKLWSLENSYNADDLKAFDEKIKKVAHKQGFDNYQYFIEPKYDGLSVELIYQEGKLIQASTRWDGITWEDITQNVKTIKNIPLKLQNAPYLLSVRGEIMMRKSVLLKLNQEREKKWEEPFSNTRNAAAWSIKLLDVRETEKRALQCFIYEVLYAENENGDLLESYDIPEEFEHIDLNEEKGDIDTMIAICLNPETKQKLEEQDYDFDGLVIKLEEQKKENKSEWLRELIGTTDHHPKWAIAYKFPAKQVETQILSVDFQIGRTGLITPVANLDPVSVSGVEISRVSLHNFDFITQKDIRLHDHIWIQRSWEVIPYVTSVIKDRRTWEEDLINPPLFCPQCNAPIFKIEGLYYCSNLNCKAQLKEKIKYFVSKECLNILGIGENLIDLLVEHGIFTTISDVYKLWEIETQIYLRKLPWFWEKRIEDIVKELENSKKCPFWRVLNALGVPNIWKKTAQDIEYFLKEKNLSTFEEMIAFLGDREKMQELHGIGEKTTLSLEYYFSNTENKKLLQTLKEIWLNFQLTDEKREEKASFCITGSFPFPREKIIKTMQNHGYTFHDQVKKTTNMLFCGENAGSKEGKAKELWIPIYHREEAQTFYPFLKEIEKENQKSDPQKTMQQSLF